MPRKLTFLCFPAFYLFLLFAPLAQATWETEVLEYGVQITSLGDHWLAIDATGRLHGAYGNGLFFQARSDGQGWTAEVVDSSAHLKNEPSLALGPEGDVPIAYYDYDNRVLKYVHGTGPSWQVETVDTQAGALGLYGSLALDSSGQPRIACGQGTVGDLVYARKDGEVWTLVTVDGVGDVGRCADLALDGAGHPHISYWSIAGEALKHAYRDETGWHLQVVDHSAALGTHSPPA